MRRDILAQWLPEALATLCAIVSGFGKAKLAPEDFLDAWGLDDPASATARAEADAAASVGRLQAWSARRNAEKKEARK